MSSRRAAAAHLQAPHEVERQSGVGVLRRGAFWLTISVVSVGLLNYGYSLAVAWSLSAPSFSTFAAGQALLLVAGTIAAASVPWLLAHEIADARDDAERRRRALWFTFVLSAVLGSVVALGVAALGATFTSGASVAVLGAGALTIFLATAPIGYLQGFARFRAMALLRFVEAAVKVAAGLALIALGVSVAGALAGFVAGAAVMLGLGLRSAAVDLSPRWPSLGSRPLWRSAAGLGVNQGAVAGLAAFDTVLVAVLTTAPADAASYQLAVILGRIPVFIAGAVAAAAFTSLRSNPAQARELGVDAVRLYLALAVPATVLIVTAPAAAIDTIFPQRYDRIADFLPYTAVAGVGIGSLTVVAALYLARERFARCGLFLGLAVAAQGVAGTAGWVVSGLEGLAVGIAAATMFGVVLFGLDQRRVALSLNVHRELLAAIAVTVLLAFLPPAGWAVAAAALVVVVGVRVQRGL